ncbi:transposase, partial [Rhizobium sp. NZLR8]|uniref:IS110 family transposase n=1 Tax=Rhizobium sp. NZLR8 TaxID=2731104 RepID=UPI002180C020
IACALANPRHVRRFAEAMGFLEKTDRIDAAMIAHYAETKRLAALPPPKAAQMRLSALMARLSQVTSDLTVQRQRRSAARDHQSVASLNEVIALVLSQIFSKVAEPADAGHTYAASEANC